jgi:hypothetical protein
VRARWQQPITFLGGMAILGYETLVEKADRPYLLGVAAMMIGLPIALGLDRIKQNRDDDNTP